MNTKIIFSQDRCGVSGRRREAFTIVELLIVIVVIGILAAISVVAYNGIQNRAHSTAIKNDLSNIVKKMEMYKALEGRYPNHYAAQLQVALDGFKATRSAYGDGVVTVSGTHNLLYCVSTDGQQYGVISWNKSSQGFAIIDGSVQDVEYGPAGYTTSCPRINSTWSGSANHRWLHYLGEWSSYI